MRELHDGIDLLKAERDGGPSVFNNWDRWVERAEEVAMFLDAQIKSRKMLAAGVHEPSWLSRGFVCGVEWPTFRKTVERYRTWLYEQCGGKAAIRDQLVFAHNDVCSAVSLALLPQ